MPGRDDDLDLIKGLSVDRDDTDQYRHTGRRKTRRSDATGTRDPQARATMAHKPEKRSGGTGWLTGFVILLLIGGCAWLALQVIELQKQVAETSNSLQLARTRVDVIGQQLHTTGSSVLDSENTIEKKFKELDSEIRKLWDVSNKRNKAQIAENAAELDKQDEQFKSIDSALKEAQKNSQKSLAQVDSMVSGQKQLDKKLLQVSRELRAENVASRATLDDLGEQVLLVRGELEQMQIRINQLPKNLPSRFEENEEAIRAIDAARRQLVESVTQLQNRVNQIQLSIGQGKTVSQ